MLVRRVAARDASKVHCRLSRIVATALAIAVVAGPATAQTLQPSFVSLPGSVDPGRLLERLRPAPAPAPIPEIVSPDVPENVAPDQAGQTRIALRKIIIDESSIYSPADLEPLYKAFLDKTISLLDVYRVADAVTTKYRSDGYVLSRAVVPAQRIVDGEVHIRAVEGFIQSVVFKGEATPEMAAIGEIAKRSRPLRATDLERCLLLINDLPGIVGHGVLAPSPGVAGGSDLTIVVDRSALSAAVSVDDRGTTFVGPLQFATEAQINNTTGHSDRLGVRYITTPAHDSELRYVELNYVRPLGGSGVTMSLLANWSRALPGAALQSNALKTEAKGDSFIARATYPLIRTRAQNLALDASFAVRNASVDQLALPSETRLVSSYIDHIRELHLGVSYDEVDDWQGRDFVRIELVQGLPILDASPGGRLTNSSRPGGLTTFTKATADASRVQNLDVVTPGLNLLTAASGGWSFGQSLLAAEQFSVGGSEYGRGYDPGELSGDYGFSGKAELQYSFRPNFSAIPGLGYLTNGAGFLQIYNFFDYGLVWDQYPGLLGQNNRSRSLASTGVGLRANLSGRFLASAEVSKPLTRSVAAYADRADSKPFQFYFSVAARF